MQFDCPFLSWCLGREQETRCIELYLSSYKFQTKSGAHSASLRWLPQYLPGRNTDGE
jgi:hypothetical protein